MKFFLWTVVVQCSSGVEVFPWIKQGEDQANSSSPAAPVVEVPSVQPKDKAPARDFLGSHGSQEANPAIFSREAKEQAKAAKQGAVTQEAKERAKAAEEAAKVKQAKEKAKAAKEAAEAAKEAAEVKQSAPIAQPVRLRVEMTNRTAVSQPLMTPKVYFLFLAMDKISNLGIWNSFFSTAPTDMYRVYVHCKFREACEQQLAGSVFQLVATVPSYYCTDLVSPMSQLLNVALQDTHLSHPNDKFAFLSDSTLPGKPFAHIHATLSGRPGSDFCVFPSKEWADNYYQGQLSLLPKHHQWSVLVREHAEKSWSLWSTGKMHDIMYRFRMNSQPLTWRNNTFADQRNFGCLDEFWHMAALYGVMYSSPNPNSVTSLAKFTGSQLKLSGYAGWQGACDTFVIWAKYMGKDSGASNPFYRLMNSLDPPSVPHGGNNMRPGWWDQMSTTGMAALRHSDFLFIRKFIDNPYLTDGGDFQTAYIQQVLL